MRIRAIVGPAGVLLAAVLPCPLASAAGIDEQSATLTYHFFTDADGISATTRAGEYGLQWGNGADVTVGWASDVVVIPAIDAPRGSAEAVDAVTSASRPITGNADPYADFVKVRNVAQGAVAYHGVSGGYYVSDESDYFAQMVSVGWNHDFLDENLNVAVAFDYGWDDIRPLADDDGNTEANSQISRHMSLVATRIVTPTTVVRVGAEANRVSGLQHDPYRTVWVAGRYLPEQHPSERFRRDAFVTATQYLPNRSSLRFEARWYDDDWSIASTMLGGRLAQRIHETLSIRYRYRFYDQGAASFFRDEYVDADGVDGYQTLDYRLGDFASHLFGGHIYWDTDGALGRWDFLRETHLGFGYERYFNSNNFTANILETTLEVGF